MNISNIIYMMLDPCSAHRARSILSVVYSEKHSPRNERSEFRPETQPFINCWKNNLERFAFLQSKKVENPPCTTTDRYRGISRWAPSRWDGNFVTRLAGLPRAHRRPSRLSATNIARSTMVGATCFSNPYWSELPPLLHQGVCCTHGARWHKTGGEDRQKSDDF